MTITITSPTSGQSLTGAFTITGQQGGDTVTAKDGTTVLGTGTAGTSGYSISANTSGLANGAATISVSDGVSTANVSVTINNLVTSPNGSTIPSLTQLVDTALNVWTVVSGVVYENGATAGFTASVTTLLWYNGVIWQENAGGLWWPWSGSAWTGSGVGDPRVTTPTLHFYGVGGHYVQGGIYSTNIAQQVADMQALGVKCIRQDCYSTTDTATMESLISSFAPIVIQPVFIVFPTTTNETTAYNQFHAYGVTVAGQLAGKVPVIELMNEPENFYFSHPASNNGQNITDWSADQSQWNAFRGACRGFVDGFRSIDTTKQTLLAMPSVSWLHYGIISGLWNGTAPNGSSGHPTCQADLVNQHWYADMDDITDAGNTNTNVLSTLQSLFGVPTILTEIGVQYTETEAAIDSYISTIVAFYAANAATYNIAAIGWYELYNFDNNSGFLMGLYSAQGVANAGRAAAMTAVIAANPKS